MTSTGALSAYSGAKTGRSPLDKRVVKEPGSDREVWWGPVNKPMSPEVSFQLVFEPFPTPEPSLDRLRPAIKATCDVWPKENTHVTGITSQHQFFSYSPPVGMVRWRIP